jgi:C-terminal processing protease CtpA/Prc
MRTTAPDHGWRSVGANPLSLAFLCVASVSLLLLASLTGCGADHGTIGAVIAQEPDTGRLFLRDVPPGLAAARAGLKVGDEILLIDGVDVRAMDARQIHAVLTGDVDDQVKLTLVRGEQIVRVTLKRTEAQKLIPPSKAAEAQ